MELAKNELFFASTSQKFTASKLVALRFVVVIFIVRAPSVTTLPGGDIAP